MSETWKNGKIYRMTFPNKSQTMFAEQIFKIYVHTEIQN